MTTPKRRPPANVGSSRSKIIATINTPLSFFGLVVLLVEGVFGLVAWRMAEGSDRTLLIKGMLALIFVLVIVVSLFAYFRPEALRGNRVGSSELFDRGENPQTRDLSVRTLVNKISAGHPTLPFRGSSQTLYADFDTQFFQKCFEESSDVICYFIHGRKWRESCHHLVEGFLGKQNSHLTVFLPDLDNKPLIDATCEHFVDGPNLPAFIRDAYAYYVGLAERYPGKVEVRRCGATYSTYSFYKFDKVILMAMYPTSARKAPPPAFVVDLDSEYGKFVAADILVLRTTSPPLTKKESDAFQGSS